MMSEDQNGLLSMDKLFREAMQLHRNTVKELLAAKDRISKLEQSRKNLSGKARIYHEKCSSLEEEIRQLHVRETNHKSIDGTGCKTCSYLQHSMESLTEAYKKTLQEKERAIKLLEDRLAEVSQLKSEKTIKNISQDPTIKQGTSEVHTDRLSNGKDGVKDDNQSSKDEDIVMTTGSNKDEISPSSRRTLLTLAKDRQKKSRYQECTLSDVVSRSHKNGVQKKGMSDKHFDENCTDGNNRRSSKRVRVADGDGSLLADSNEDDGHPFQNSKLRKKDQLCPNIVVPETMAMDYVYSDEDSSDSAELPPVGGLIQTKGDNFNLGPPSASSTQKINHDSNEKSTKSQTKKLDLPIIPKGKIHKEVGVNNQADPDIDVTIIGEDDAEQTVIKNVGNSTKKKPLNSTHEGMEDAPQSPVFIGSKTNQKPTEFRSPCLYEDDDVQIFEESSMEDSQSPCLLRRETSLRNDGVEKEIRFSQDDSQSPSLLNRNPAKRSSNNSCLSPSIFKKDSPLNKSQNRCASRPKRNRTSQKNVASEKDLKQTTLTQKFFSEDDVTDYPSVKIDTDFKFKEPLVEAKRTQKLITPRLRKTEIDSDSDLDVTVAPDSELHVLEKNTVFDDLHPGDQNASVDPAILFSLDFPETVAIDNQFNGQKNEKSSISEEKLNKLGEDESQLLPCSSKSFKFKGKGRITNEAHEDEVCNKEILDEDNEEGVSDIDEPEEEVSLHSSFDRVPKKVEPDFAYVDVVRKKDERRKLNAHACQECENYYKNLGLSVDERASRMKDCSRHRARYIPPSTPEHFWSIGIPSTPECEKRGYIKKHSPKGPPRCRRKRRLEKRFKAKSEEAEEDDDTTKENDLNSSVVFNI